MVKKKKTKVNKKKSLANGKALANAENLAANIKNTEADKKNVLNLTDLDINTKIDNYHSEERLNTNNSRFLLEKHLGSGGMCDVYEAIDLRRHEWGDPRPKVAVKKLLPEFKNNIHAKLALAQEFYKVRNLTHPSIVRHYDLHQENDELIISMELLQGKTLEDYFRDNLKENYPLKNVSFHIFEVLAYIHQKGVVHADFKPGNIFFNQGKIVVFDFNISVVLPTIQDKASSPIQALIKANSLPGLTKLYASPERLSGESPSYSDDIFGASCTVYELLAGKHPFQRCLSDKACEMGINPLRPDKLSRRQWAYLLAGLNFKAEKRPEALELAHIFSKTNIFFVFWNKFF